MGALLEAREVVVRRGRRAVLSGVELSVTAGEALRIEGANGSGKTSLLRVLAGLAPARGGTVVRYGACAWVPEKVLLTSAMRCGEWLAAMRRLRGLPAVDWKEPVAASGLDPAVLAATSASLSKGMLQRIALLEALTAEPALLLADEPFAGLDADGAEWLREALRRRLGGGGALLLTGHPGTAPAGVPPGRVLRLRDGRCEPVVGGPSRVTVRASHPDGRRLARSISAGESDAALRALLDDGWHVEELRP